MINVQLRRYFFLKVAGPPKFPVLTRFCRPRTAGTGLQVDISQIARSGTAVERQTSAFGRKYEVDGILRGPAGREARVTTVWIVKNGEDFPRLVTIFPGDDR
jgi:hypothetical protein